MTAEASSIDNATQPKVIIRCLVYNHEPYLRACLEGFVMQKTNFPFKAVVHDDCSTDGSAAIIREYAEKYPDIIEPIFETENQYSKRDGSLRRIMDEATLGRSTYIAFCEGDDYWIDPLKLQKQVDFLDEHLDFSMCFSACELKNETNTPRHFAGTLIENRSYTADELLNTWQVPTASICLREQVLHDSRRYDTERKTLFGDIIIILTAAHNGKVQGMEDKMTVYRINSSSLTNSTKYTPYIKRKLPSHYKYIKLYFPLVKKSSINRQLFYAHGGIFIAKDTSLYEKISSFFMMCRYDFARLLKVTVKRIIKSKKNMLTPRFRTQS